MFPQLTQFADFSLLALRLMVGLVLITSGWSHVTKSDERSKSIGMSKGFTIFLGVAEMAGAVGVAFGVFTQLAATGLILVMLGRHPEEDLRLAYRFLGRENLRLAL
jgi:putative oxidoreductase